MTIIAEPQTLRAFVAVAREGNVSRAAQRLHLSQPAVSLQLKRLAQSTGLVLFNRAPHGLALTRLRGAAAPGAGSGVAVRLAPGFAATQYRLPIDSLEKIKFTF
jgi:DNA-binding PucR family transcriptional regulator